MAYTKERFYRVAVKLKGCIESQWLRRTYKITSTHHPIGVLTIPIRHADAGLWPLSQAEEIVNEIKEAYGSEIESASVPKAVVTKFFDEQRREIPRPTAEQLQFWMFDGVAETPDGERVEPDHPDSWISLLGYI